MCHVMTCHYNNQFLPMYNYKHKWQIMNIIPSLHDTIEIVSWNTHLTFQPAFNPLIFLLKKQTYNIVNIIHAKLWYSNNYMGNLVKKIKKWNLRYCVGSWCRFEKVTFWKRQWACLVTLIRIKYFKWPFLKLMFLK